ncbi:hypothetical protein C0993_000273 [Termitomyces sp. T159_Od127]|nr:hypothetical protein C0993_000273 [Termitomyces sp. T159_Od127]
MYHLPLLPGYGHQTKVRSSKASNKESILAGLLLAEETGYQDTYFSIPTPQPSNPRQGFTSTSIQIPCCSPDDNERLLPSGAQVEPKPFRTLSSEAETPLPRKAHWQLSSPLKPEEDVAEVIFFDYGVIVFFGLHKRQERDILEDIAHAGISRRPLKEDQWQVEEYNFAYDPQMAYPRIYNDFFTLKSRSHLLKLSIAHALAQSTLLARYETIAQEVLSSPLARSIPSQLVDSGKVRLHRRDALKLTGQILKLRRDVMLNSTVLDIPELFWNEVTLVQLYEAVREYMEIDGRVRALNVKLGITRDFVSLEYSNISSIYVFMQPSGNQLGSIDEHLDNREMKKITWIIIW